MPFFLKEVSQNGIGKDKNNCTYVNSSLFVLKFDVTKSPILILRGRV